MDIDYLDLLVRYIRHVGECEGTTFLSAVWHEQLESHDFTAADLETLRALEVEAFA